MTMSGANSIPERVVGVRPASVKNGLSPRSQPRFSRPLIRPPSPTGRRIALDCDARRQGRGDLEDRCSATSGVESRLGVRAKNAFGVSQRRPRACTATDFSPGLPRWVWPLLRRSSAPHPPRSPSNDESGINTRPRAIKKHKLQSVIDAR